MKITEVDKAILDGLHIHKDVDRREELARRLKEELPLTGLGTWSPGESRPFRVDGEITWR